MILQQLLIGKVCEDGYLINNSRYHNSLVCKLFDWFYWSRSRSSKFPAPVVYLPLYRISNKKSVWNKIRIITLLFQHFFWVAFHSLYNVNEHCANYISFSCCEKIELLLPPEKCCRWVKWYCLVHIAWDLHIGCE